MKVRQFTLSTYHIVFATVLMALITITTYIYAPNKLTDRMISGLYSDRALEWHDEIAELGVIKSTFYELDKHENNFFKEYKTHLINMATVAEISLVSLYTPEGKLAWKSGDTPESPLRLDTTTLFSDNTLSSDKIHDADVMIKHNMLEDGVSEEDRHHTFAIAVIPDNRYGKTVGLLQLTYDVTRAYDWYMKQIQITILTVGSIIVLALFISAIANYLFTRAVKKSDQKTFEREAEITRITEERRKEGQAIREFGEWLQTSRSTSELFSLVSTFMTMEAEEFSGQLYIYDSDREYMELATQWGHNEHCSTAKIHADNCWAMRRGRVYRHGAEQISFQCGHVNADAKGYICIPMIANGEAVGLVTLNPESTLSQEELERKNKFIETCIEQISMALSNVMLRDKLEQQSLRDPLTKIQNRRAFQIELVKHTLPNKKVDFVMIDIDHFKSFNDSFGHNAGDYVLQNVCSLLEDEPDCSAFRMGGEEMALLIPREGKSKNNMKIEAIRNKIEKMTLSFAGQTLPTVTASFGAIQFPECTDSVESIVQLADEALYKAKHNGRNCVVWYKSNHVENTKVKNKK